MSVEADLCKACGMCCNGTLFHSVTVTEEERRKLGNGPEYFTDEKGDLHMRQGCVHLSAENGCTVYKDRPAVCQKYSCLLLDRLRSGKLSPRQAQAILKTLFDLFADLRASCQRIMPQIEWPERLVSRSLMSDLVELAEEQGADVSLYDWLKIEVQRQAIVTYLRLHFRLKFQASEPQADKARATGLSEG